MFTHGIGFGSNKIQIQILGRISLKEQGGNVCVCKKDF